MKKGIVLISGSVLISVFAAAALPPLEMAAPDFPTIVFSNAVPSEFSADARSKLSISTTYYRGEAKSSLQWDWDKPGASIVFKHPDVFKRLSGEDPDPIVYDYVTCTTLSSFSLWVFNETPLREALFFEIGDGKTPDCRFWMNLNFSGWKELAFIYGRDLTGFPNPKTASTLRIIAPNGIPGLCDAEQPKGRLYFSHFAPRKEMDVRFVQCSVAPWVGVKSIGRNWAIGLAGAGESLKVNIPLPEILSPDQMEILRRLSETFLAGYGYGQQPKIRKVKQAEVEALCHRLTDKYGIKREGRFVSGNVTHGFPGDATAVANLFLAAKGQPDVQDALFTLFVDMMSLDGYSIGGYGWRDYCITPLTLMKEALKARGQWDRIYAKVNGSFSDFYELKPGGNADVFNTALYGKLGVLFLKDDGPGKWRDLLALQHWMEGCAVRGAIQSDGSFFHHNLIYSGYNLPAMFPLAGVLRLVHGSPFEPPKMEAAVKKSAKVMAFYANPSIPHFFSGRHRDGAGLNWGFAMSVFKPLAECGSPVDREMAELFLAYAKLFPKESANNPDVARYQAIGLKPAVLSGHLALNYAAVGVQRRDDWMLMVRGQKSGFRANEAYPGGAENTLGRFLNYGHMILVAPGTVNFSWHMTKPGKGVQGWNWALWPGTTSRLLPHDVLRSRFEVEETVTTEPFCGDVALDGNGVWGLKLQEEIPGSIDPCRIGPAKYWIGDRRFAKLIAEAHYDKDFRARKSVFMFDDRVVCLGSGIQSSDRDYPAITTLFQNPLPKGAEMKFAMDGQAEACFPLETDVRTGKQAQWMLDSTGIGYYIPTGNDGLTVERKLQKLPFHPYWSFHKPELQETVVPNEGATELAYFNHGIRPKDGRYEYAMLIKATPEKMAAFTTTVPYRVLRHDNQAHIVRDVSSKTTGYVVFEVGREIGPDITTVSAPCIVMIKDLEGGKKKFSFCNPDLGRQYACTGAAEETEQIATVSLKGKWKLSGETKEATAEVKGLHTTLTFRTFGARPVTLVINIATSGFAHRPTRQRIPILAIYSPGLIGAISLAGLTTGASASTNFRNRSLMELKTFRPFPAEHGQPLLYSFPHTST